jgi:hypothetical protein
VTEEERRARQREKARRWYLANQALTRERARQYRIDHPEQVRAVQQCWRRANPEKVAAYQRKYEASYPERVAESKRRSRIKQRRAQGIAPRPPRLSDEERQQRQRQAKQHYWARHRDDPEWRAAYNARAQKRRAQLPDQRKGALRQAGAAWRAANPEIFRAAIRRWERANKDRLDAARRRWYAAHRAAVIERSQRRKQYETAAMQFLREQGLLPPFTRETQWLRRGAALAFLRRAGLLGLEERPCGEPRA